MNSTRIYLQGSFERINAAKPAAHDIVHYVYPEPAFSNGTAVLSCMRCIVTRPVAAAVIIRWIH